MRRWQYLSILLLGGCIASTFKSSTSHVELAQQAFQRGDLDTAERQYETALSRAEGPGAAWVRNEVARGRGQIGIVRLRSRVNELRALPTPPLEAIATVQAEREHLRGFGGDDKLDADLVITVGLHAERAITDILDRAKKGELFAAAHAVAPLLAYPDLPASVIERATAIRTTAAAVATDRAKTAGASHPLVQRVHLAHAASLGGTEVADASAMLVPYARGVDVTVNVPNECEMSTLSRSLAQPGQTRKAAVRVDITACGGRTETKTSTQNVTWTEKVFDGYDTITVPEQQCEEVCGSVLTGRETCSTNYNASPPNLVCVKEVKTSCFDRCVTVQVPKQVPRYKDEERKGSRTVTTEVSIVQIMGTWTVTREGKEETGTISQIDRNEYATAPATGGVDPYVSGVRRTPDQLAVSATESTRSSIQAGIDRLFAEDVAAATARARTASAANRIDDEEEAWVQAVVLGGTDLGPLATRYDFVRERLVAMFGPQKYVAPAVTSLSAATVFPPVPRADTPQITTGDLDDLQAALFGRFTLQVDAAYRSLPTVMGMSGEEAGGDSAFLVGANAATRALSLKAKPWGFQLTDEAGAHLALGGRTGGPMVIDNVVSPFAATFGVHYAVGAGYRKPAHGALFAGVRGQYEGFLLGTSTGDYATLPLFVRAEAPLVKATIAVEATGVALAGASHWGLSLRAVNRRAWNDDARMKYFQLRIEHTTVDATSTDFGATGAVDGERMLDGVGLTSVHIMYGAGW